MKRHKELGLSWACGHGQHALDEHDRDTQLVGLNLGLSSSSLLKKNPPTTDTVESSNLATLQYLKHCQSLNPELLLLRYEKFLTLVEYPVLQ